MCHLYYNYCLLCYYIHLFVKIFVQPHISLSLCYNLYFCIIIIRRTRTQKMLQVFITHKVCNEFLYISLPTTQPTTTTLDKKIFSFMFLLNHGTKNRNGAKTKTCTNCNNKYLNRKVEKTRKYPDTICIHTRLHVPRLQSFLFKTFICLF